MACAAEAAPASPERGKSTFVVANVAPPTDGREAKDGVPPPGQPWQTPTAWRAVARDARPPPAQGACRQLRECGDAEPERSPATLGLRPSSSDPPPMPAGPTPLPARTLPGPRPLSSRGALAVGKAC